MFQLEMKVLHATWIFFPIFLFPEKMLPEVHLDFIKGLVDLRFSFLEKEKQTGELAWGPRQFLS